ncbi:substrate-binding domain-containing protein [Oscillospiraceae bacterium PP1C4]
MKRLVALILVLAMAFSVTACGTPPAAAPAPDATAAPASEAAKPADKQLTFTFVLPQAANEIWGVAKEGFEEGCAAYGVKANVVAPTKPNDINEMNSLIEIAIAEKVDGVITQAVNPEGQAPAFAKLDEAGIPYCIVNSDAPDSKRLGFIGTGSELGRVAGEAIVEAMEGEEIRCATALWAPSAVLAIAIKDAYYGAFTKNAGGYKEMLIIDTQSDQLKTTTDYQNAFAANPDINVCINICGFGAPAAAKAVKEAGKEGQVIIMGIDDIQETLDGIKDGTIFATMTQNFYRMGYEPVKWLAEFNKDGTKPAKAVNDSGTLVVTKDNIETYKKDMRDPSKW